MWSNLWHVSLPLMHWWLLQNSWFLMCNVVYMIYCIADLESIANSQKSLGIGQEEKARRVRWKREKKKRENEGGLGEGGVGVVLDLKGSWRLIADFRCNCLKLFLISEDFFFGESIISEDWKCNLKIQWEPFHKIFLLCKWTCIMSYMRVSMMIFIEQKNKY